MHEYLVNDCILLRRAYLGLHKVARLEGASCDSWRQVLGERLDILVVLFGELLLVLGLF